MSRLCRTPNQADKEAISDELDVINNVAASKNLEAQEHLLAGAKALQENIATSERSKRRGKRKLDELLKKIIPEYLLCAQETNVLPRRNLEIAQKRIRFLETGLSTASNVAKDRLGLRMKRVRNRSLEREGEGGRD